MATKKNSAMGTDSGEVLSLKDAGYRASSVGFKLMDIARFVASQDVNFVEDPKKETLEALREGMKLACNERWGAKFYRTIDGHFVQCEEKDPGAIAVSVYTATALTGQEFGKLKESEPAKHKIIGEWRHRFAKHCSQTINTIKANIRKLSEGERARAPTKDFAVAMKDAFDSFEKRVKTAIERGDTTANTERFKAAVAAFWSTYNAK